MALPQLTPLITLMCLSASISFIPNTAGFGIAPHFSQNIISSRAILSKTPSFAQQYKTHSQTRRSNKNYVLSSTADSTSELALIGQTLTDAMLATELFKDVKICIAPSKSNRLGVFATQDIKSDEVALSIPYDDMIILTAEYCQKTALKQYIPENYDGWTGDAGLVAIQLLYELARSVSQNPESSEFQPRRNIAIQSFMSAWVQSLPFTNNDYSHPLSTWSEDSQELLQDSSTKKIYQLLDDIEEDAAWWEQRIWSQNRDAFPESVEVPSADGESTVKRDCFNQAGLKWALSMVNSRSVFVDGMLRLVPIADYANHYDDISKVNTIEAQEIQTGFFGTFGTSKGVQVKSPVDTRKKNAVTVRKEEEVFVSYGPKTPIDYLLEHGFVPKRMIEIASQPQQKSLSNRSKSTLNRGLSEVAELTFEIPSEDRFYDDKLDILEFESPLGNPSQSFDVTSVDDPDPVMIQFLRLMKLEGMDAFLLESIFRKEVWDFMGAPVSEKNERMVVDEISVQCSKAIKDMDDLAEGDEDEASLQKLESIAMLSLSSELSCTVVRVLERRALTETITFMDREKEALDLKEYYQERRLKDLGLDSEWSEDQDNPDVGWGQTRAPGGGDLDW